jgi:hypothetical protein
MNILDMNHTQESSTLIFKYRDWNNEYHRRLLFEQELFFSSYLNFNDPFDGTLPFKYSDFSKKAVIRKIIEAEFKTNPHQSTEEICHKITDLNRRGALDPQYILPLIERCIREKISPFLKEVGIACFCHSEYNFLLWSYYANNHTGITIGFKKDELVKDVEGGTYKNVDYDDEFPLIQEKDGHMEIYKKLIYQKSKKWEHEQEYRLTKTNFAARSIKLKPETIAEVIIGSGMNDTDQQTIIEYVKQQLPFTKVYKMNLSSTEYGLVKVPVD